MQVVHTSKNLGDHRNFANVNATAHFDYLSIAAAPGSTSLITLTQAPKTWSSHVCDLSMQLRFDHMPRHS